MFLSSDNLNVNRVVEVPLNIYSQTFIDALQDRIKTIVETMPAPYTLFVSGGVDSQAMLYAWHLSKQPFEAVNITYDHFNTHDFKEMEIFARDLGVEIRQINFPIIDFLEHRLDDFAWKYECSSPQICTHMAFSQLIGKGTKIFSGNALVINQLTMNNTIYGLQRYATMSGDSIVPFFLMDDEVLASISATVGKQMKEDTTMTPYEFKCSFYRKLGFPIFPQVEKLTGFELLRDYYDGFPHRVTARMKLRHSSLTSPRVFDQLFRNKYMIVLKNHYQSKFVERL